MTQALLETVLFVSERLRVALLAFCAIVAIRLGAEIARPDPSPPPIASAVAAIR